MTKIDPALDAYTPPAGPLSPHCEAAKDLLAWMRNMGIRCEALNVGTEGIQILGLTDDYPRKQPQVSREPKPRRDDDLRDFTD
jgi:hypothetical protein